MQNLRFLQQPQTGDKGSVFWPALSNNIAILDAHNHDGVTSAPLSSQAVVALTAPDLLSSGWSAIGDGSGQYQQLVTVPNGLPALPYIVAFKISGGSRDTQPIFPQIVRNTDFSFYVKVNDPTLNLHVYFTT